MQTAIAALSTSKPTSLPEALPRRWVARVFERLSGQLGTKMADLYAGVPPDVVQGEWGEGLAGFHEVELQRGIAACRTRVFAPTLGEFLRLCRPALDPEAAFYEAGDCLRERDAGEVGAWTHPAVWRAACTMSMEVRAGDYKACRVRWAHVLNREFAEGWGEILAPAMRIEHNAKVGPPPAEIRERLKQLRAGCFVAAEGAEASE